MRRLDQPAFISILIGYLVAGILYARLTPPWQAPDEPAHYNYVRQLADGILPVIEPSDYDQAYQTETISSRFDPQYSVEPFEYEDHQPPLYYLLQTPIFAATGGSLFAMRLFSVLLGGGIVVLAYLIARRVFPNQGWLALTATAFVAFLPQHVAILASVNNDSLAWLLVAGMLWALLRLDGSIQTNQTTSGLIDKKMIIALATLLGLGFVTKGTTYIMLPLIAGWVAARFWGDWEQMAKMGATLFVPAFAIGTLWWGRNLVVYEGVDVMATAAHNEAVTGQLRTEDHIADVGIGRAARQLARITFRSFWGQFGWMGVPLPRQFYLALTLFSGAMALGLFMPASWRNHTPLPKLARNLFIGVLALNLALYLGYNLAFVQNQGRYLFASLIPIGVAVAAGGAAWGGWLQRISVKALYVMPASLAGGLFALDLYALFRFIIPCLTFGSTAC